MATIRERTTNSGEKRYLVEVRLKGFKPQRETFTRKTDAKRWGEKTEVEMRDGRHFKTTESKKKTVAELIDKYISDVMPHKKQKTKLKQAMQLQWWKDEIGYLTLSDLSTSKLAEKRDLLLKDKSPATTTRYLAALSHPFTIACNEWEWIDINPLTKVSRPKEPKGRVRFLDRDERLRLLNSCKASEHPYLYTVVVIALSTGMRQMEILSLTWNQIDFSRQQAFLTDTKNGERRALPITGHAMELLKELNKVRHIESKLVFPGLVDPKTPFCIRKPWKKAIEAADIQDFRFHDLRHTAASYLAMNGATLAEIAEILGHKSLQMVHRYAHLSDQHTHGVVASMNEKIFNG